MDNCVRFLTSQNATCVIENDGTCKMAFTSGIRPLLDWIEESPELLKEASVADKVVGKAAAMLFRYSGIRKLHALLISEHALAALKDSEIEVTYDKCVPYIINRTKDGMCPMEQRVLNCDDPSAAYEILKKPL